MAGALHAPPEGRRFAITVDELAHHFGTIGYEVLTSLGSRYARVYKGGAAHAAGQDKVPATPTTAA